MQTCTLGDASLISLPMESMGPRGGISAELLVPFRELRTRHQGLPRCVHTLDPQDFISTSILVTMHLALGSTQASPYSSDHFLGVQKKPTPTQPALTGT